MLDYVDRCIDESSLFIVNIIHQFKYQGMTGFALLTYFADLTPWATQKGYKVNGFEQELINEDPKWVRDEPLVLVKLKNEFENKQEFDNVCKCIAQVIKEPELEKLLKVMKLRLEDAYIGKRKKMSKQVNDWLSRFKDGRMAPEETEDIIRLWMGDKILGPIAVARALEQEYYYEKPRDYPVDVITCSIRTKLPGFYTHKIRGITLLDDKYFVLPSEEVHEMNFPNDIKLDRVSYSEERYIEKPSEAVFECLVEGPYHIDHEKDEDDDDDDSDEDNEEENDDDILNDDYAYDIAVKKISNDDTESDHYFIAMRYGSLVFQGVDKIMVGIYQGEKFKNWVEPFYTYWNAIDAGDIIKEFNLSKQHVKNYEELKQQCDQNQRNYEELKQQFDQNQNELIAMQHKYREALEMIEKLKRKET